MNNLVKLHGKSVSKEEMERKLTPDDIQALKDAGIEDPLMEDE